MIPHMQEWLWDTLERTAATYLQSVVGLMTASAVGLVDLTLVKSALVGSIPAALAVLKAALATRYGDQDTAAVRRGDAPYAGREHP